jgi:hypothetical protein
MVSSFVARVKELPENRFLTRFALSASSLASFSWTGCADGQFLFAFVQSRLSSESESLPADRCFSDIRFRVDWIRLRIRFKEPERDSRKRKLGSLCSIEKHSRIVSRVFLRDHVRDTLTIENCFCIMQLSSSNLERDIFRSSVDGKSFSPMRPGPHSVRSESNSVRTRL